MAYFTPAEIQAMTQAGVAPPVVTPQMIAYCRLHYILIFASVGYSIATLLLILQFRVSQRLAALTARLRLNRTLQIALFTILLALLIALIRLPFSWYVGFHVDHSFGLSHQNFGDWLADLAKGKVVDAMLDALCFTVAFGIINRFKRRWDLVLWAALLPLIAGGIFLAPLVVDPLFNKFTVMPSSSIEQSIRAIAARAGIAGAPIFVVDRSKQTEKVNAYVTGLGSSTRVVIWDTTLAKLPPDQIEAVVAHETGHYVLGHIVMGFVLTAVGLLALLLLLSKFAEAIIARLPRGWAVHSLTDLNAIPVILLAVTVGGFLFSPVDNAVSRAMEHQADEFGLKITHNRPAMARTFVSLSQQNLSEPEPPPFIKFWFYSHPSLRERILFALGL